MIKDTIYDKLRCSLTRDIKRAFLYYPYIIRIFNHKVDTVFKIDPVRYLGRKSIELKFLQRFKEDYDFLIRGFLNEFIIPKYNSLPFNCINKDKINNELEKCRGVN